MIKVFITDVDGTLTDGKINVSPSGECMKSFNVKDGYGLLKIKNAGIIPIIITGRKSDILLKRAVELGIEEVYQGVRNKSTLIEAIAKRYGCLWDNKSSKYEEIAYIGDDENDMDAIEICGITACPNDAWKSVREKVDYITECNGGDGAVREFIEYILLKK